jgi:predicted O-methyltransferase YrrM
LTGLSRAADAVRRELSVSPNLRGIALGTAGFAGARGAGLGARPAAIMAAATALATRTATAWRYEIQRETRNSGDAAMVAGWLGEAIVTTGGWAIEPDFGRLVVQRALQIRAPGVVVECGSGTTTLLIARALRDRGAGRLFSIENDRGYADRTWRSLQQAGLSDWVHPIVAPIERQRFGSRSVSWFSSSVIEAALPADASIDLLIVDGPPMLEPWSRWPAVEALWPRLSDECSVLLDDGRRPWERRTALAWRHAHPELELAWHDTVKGTWSLRRRAEFPIRRGVAAWMLTARRLLTPHPVGDNRWPEHR